MESSKTIYFVVCDKSDGPDEQTFIQELKVEKRIRKNDKNIFLTNIRIKVSEHMLNNQSSIGIVRNGEQFFCFATTYEKAKELMELLRSKTAAELREIRNNYKD